MRIIELIIAADADASNVDLPAQDNVIEQWEIKSKDGERIVKLLVKDEVVKSLMEKLDNTPYIKRVILYPVEGTYPRVEETEGKQDKKLNIWNFTTISKEELYGDIDQPVNMSLNFIIMVVLSAFVAGIGILKNNQAIIIGAMVIAPFLGPNMSMAFGTTLGDWPMIRKSIITGISATIIALVISVLWGLLSSSAASILPGDIIEYQDIALALICGFAGVVSAISGQGTTLVGVMVAVALLPPLMRSGLLLGAGQFAHALNAFLIFSVNIVCVNIAGIITFYLAGIKPSWWWEKESAFKKTRIAFALWCLALALLIIAISVSRQLSDNF